MTGHKLRHYRRFAIARVARFPRWLHQPRHGGGACWRRNTLGSAPRPKKSWVAFLATARRPRPTGRRAGVGGWSHDLSDQLGNRALDAPVAVVIHLRRLSERVLYAVPLVSPCGPVEER